MRRPWVVGVEVPGEGIGEERHGRAAGVVPLEWWGAPGRRHAVRTVIKAMMAQLRPPVLLVLPCSHGHGRTSRERERERLPVPGPSQPLATSSAENDLGFPSLID